MKKVILSPDCFKNKPQYEYGVKPEQRIIEKVEANEYGLFLYVKDWKYPYKGYPYPEVADAVATIKRFWMELVKIWWIFIPFKLKKLIAGYSYFILERYFLIDDLYCPFAKEVLRTLRAVAKDEDERKLAECVAMVIQHDDGYRFPFQYGMWKGGSVKEALKIIIDRQLAIESKDKYRKALRFINLLGIKGIIKKIDNEFDWTKSKMDESDMYFAKFHESFNFNEN